MQTIGLRAILSLGDFSSGVSSYNRSLDDMNRRTTSVAGSATQQYTGLGQSVLSFGKNAAIAVATGVTVLTVALGTLGLTAITTATSFESAFAGVTKTTDGLVSATGALNQTGREMRQQFVNLSKEIPVAFEELAAIGEIGGQLGIGKAALVDFTETIAKLAVTTNLTEEAAATSLARIANIYQITADDMGENTERVGSTIVSLGNNFATTEATIVEFATAIAGAGKLVGLTQADILGIGTAMSSVGVQTEAGGTAVQKVLLAINNAVSSSETGFVNYSNEIDRNIEKMQGLNAESARLEATFPGLQAEMLAQEQAFLASGGAAEEFGRQLGDSTRQHAFEVAKDLQELRAETDQLRSQHGQPIDPVMLRTFAQVSGMTVSEFKAAWEEDAATAFTAFVTGLGKQGDNATSTLEALGLTDQRLTRAFLSLSGAGDLLERSMTHANQAFADNTALSAEAEQRFRTTESQIQLLKNTIRSLADIGGSELLPFVNQGLVALRDMAEDGAEPLGAIMQEIVVPGIRKFGDILSGIKLGSIGEVFDKILEFGRIFQAGGLFGSRSGSFGSQGLIQALGITPDIITLVDLVTTKIEGLVSKVSGAFSGLSGAGGGFSFLDVLNESITFVVENFDLFEGAIVGIGAVLAGGVILAAVTAIGSAIFALATPITALVVGAGLIGAAFDANVFGIRDTFFSIVGFIQDTVLPVFRGELPDSLGIFGSMIGNVQGGVQGFINAFAGVQPLFQGFMLQIQAAIPGLTNLGLLIGGVLYLALQGISNAMSVLLPLIGEGFVVAIGVAFNAVSGLLTFLAGTGDMLMGIFTGDWEAAREGALQVFEGLKIGIIDSIVALGELFANAIEDLLDTMLPNWKTALGDMLTEAAVFVVDAIDTFNGFVDGIAELFTPGTFLEHGKAIIDGLVKGIEDNADKVLGKLREIINNAITNIKSSLGISSPSTVTMDIARQIVQGLVVGTKKETGVWERELDDLVDLATTKFKGVFEAAVEPGQTHNAQVQEGIRNFIGFFQDDLKQELRKLGTGADLGNLISRTFTHTFMQNFPGGTIAQAVVHDLIGEMEAALGPEVVAMFAEIQREIGTALISESSSFTDLADTALERLNDKLGSQLDILNEQLNQDIEIPLETLFSQEEIDKILSGLNEADLAKRIAQRLERLQTDIGRSAEQDALLELFLLEDQTGINDELIRQSLEQAGIKEKIAETEAEILATAEKQAALEKQKADLDFLKQQLDLVKTIEGLGLDPKAVLGGLTLGLDADLADLANAMDSVIELILGTVDDALEISSPSKALARRGQHAVGGLVEGMLGSMGDVRTAAQSVATQATLGMSRPNMMMAQGLFSPSPNPQVTNINFNAPMFTGDFVVKQNEGMSLPELQLFVQDIVMEAIRQ